MSKYQFMGFRIHRVNDVDQAPDYKTFLCSTQSAWLEIKGLQVRAPQEALRCVFEQDTLVCLVLVQPRKTHPDINEKSNQAKSQNKSNENEILTAYKI